MKLNIWIVLDTTIIVVFWILLFGGAIDGFGTIVFFEPGFTYLLILFSILTGAFVGGMYERWYQEKLKVPS